MSVPTSTYRLQITAQDDLQAAAGLVDYLKVLGAGAVYLSPILQSIAGSVHGYDVVDHRRVDQQRGGEPGRQQLVQAARDAGLGVVVDIVPNHMGVADATQNGAWWDVLTFGRQAAHAPWFDVDWSQPRIKIPVLGDDADFARDLSLRGAPADALTYFDHVYPVAPGTAPPGEPAATVHERQHYQLVSFRRADTEQNYRRFFAVVDLAGLRVEDHDVYAATHAEILRWVREGGVSGLRVDHPDGLVDPRRYLQRLRQDAPDAWIVVEKILEPGEPLPSDWPVAGTTGYDALAEVNALLVDPGAEPELTRVYRGLTGDRRSFADHVAAGKRMVATGILRAEVLRLARMVDGLAGAEAAITELAVAFPVYRSYAPDRLEYLHQAAAVATDRRPELAAPVRALLPRLSDPADELASRFQQLTGAVMAKGVEDTAYYRYGRLASANEVGGDPGTVGWSIAQFHDSQRQRQRRAAMGMTTLTTHDTKRGEDVRARIAVLAEIPREWEQAALTLLQAAPISNRAFGSLLWQTMLGASHASRERLHAYAEKAMREAADGTGWIDPDQSFESAVHAAVDARFDDPLVRTTVDLLAERIDQPGWSNALGQKLVQLTMPGVPDIYQGTEVWEDNLVDPDNRRRVDHASLHARLAELDARDVPPPLAGDGSAKLWLVSRVLRVRREHPEWFSGYTPLFAQGAAADHAVAFDRGAAVTVITRLPCGLAAAGGFGPTTVQLPIGAWQDRLTGHRWSGQVELGQLLDTFPVAFLTRPAA